MARRATVVKQQRNAASAFLLLDAGDSWYGEGEIGQRTRGKAVVEAMNLLGYDAMTPGELEFQLGPEDLRARMDEARFPLLTANVVSEDGSCTFAQPYIIKEMDGHRVAILGLVTLEADAIVRATTDGAFHVADPIATARKYVEDLSSQCDVILVLSHLGVDQDQVLAREVPGIDLIVGGHSLKVLQPALQDPTNGTVILQAGFLGEWVGYAKVHLDAQGRVVQFENEVILLGPEVPDDSDMRLLLTSYVGK
ncbi:MAG: bifunctional metallophosphatase/5'-nucleotidase [Anaerolineae bacterium]